MDPRYCEERLRDEVIYLHSLWHQGPPPRPTPTPPPLYHTPTPTFYYQQQQHTPTLTPPIPIPNPTPHYPLYHHQHHHHQPPPIPQPQPLFTQTGKRVRESDPPPDSGPEWPCLKDPPPQTSSGSAWPPMKKPALPTATATTTTTQPLSAESQAYQIQHKAFQPCREFLLVKDEDGDEASQDGSSSSSGNEEVDEEGEEEEEKEEEDDELSFFFKLFSEDCELRGYYLKNRDNGDFYCLVCGAIGKKAWKKFKGCVSLLHHATSILKTKRKRAHRAFAQVVCKLLNWDFHRIPNIVFKPQPQPLQLQGGPEGIAVDSKDDSDDVKKDNAAASVNDNSISLVTVSNGENANPNHPQHTPTSIPNPNSSPHYPLHHHHPLAPFPQPQLLTQTRKIVGESDLPLDSGPERPCPQDPPPETSPGWHSMKEPVSTLQPLSAEDQARQMQYRALQPCREFLLARNEDEDKTSEDGNSEEDEEELDFFLKLFSEDRELRSYYEKCYESGDFYCLVCCGTGKTVWKKFKGCVGLLQHSTSILKTKRKHAHRAFAQVICKVLGWDLHHLSARLGSSSASHYCVGLLQLQGGPQEIADDSKDDDDDVVKKDNAAACVNGNIGETNAVSVAASSGEVAAAPVNGIEQLENSTSVVTVSNGEKAISINGNSGSGENMVSVDGDNSDAIDKEGF